MKKEELSRMIPKSLAWVTGYKLVTSINIGNKEKKLVVVVVIISCRLDQFTYGHADFEIHGAYVDINFYLYLWVKHSSFVSET